MFPASTALRILPPPNLASECQREVMAELRNSNGQMMVSRHHCDWLSWSRCDSARLRV